MDRRLEELMQKALSEFDRLAEEVEKSKGEVEELIRLYQGLFENEPATQKQKDYLIKLGFPEELLKYLTKSEASRWIGRLKRGGKHG